MDELREVIKKIENCAEEEGFHVPDLRWEVVPDSYMIEVSAYAFPARMHHWMFGREYIRQKLFGQLGLSRLYEMVIMDTPPIILISENNRYIENVAVIAHVIGHIDFMYHNIYFQDIDPKMPRHAALHAARIDKYTQEHGIERVEKLLDVAFALSQHLDIYKGQIRKKPPKEYKRKIHYPDPLLYELGIDDFKIDEKIEKYKLPENDILWFLSNYAPLEQWEVDVLEMVREESHYFTPFMRTKVMNEGYAMWAQSKIMGNCDLLDDGEFLEFAVISSHVAGATGFNPYWFGLIMWEYIEKKHGIDVLHEARNELDDYGFILNYLDKEFVKKHKLFSYVVRENAQAYEFEITSKEVDKIRQVIAQKLLPIFQFPKIRIEDVTDYGTLVLKHYPPADDIELKQDYAEKTISSLGRLWKGKVKLLCMKNKRKGYFIWSPERDKVDFIYE